MAVVAAVSIYRFDVRYVLSLGFSSLFRLIEVARRLRNGLIVEDAVATRNAMNADGKEWKKFVEHYSTESPEDAEERRVSEGRAQLAHIFGSS